MDEHFVQGVVGGVLNRHKGKTLDKDRIQTLMVEVAAVLDRATQFTNVKELSEEQIAAKLAESEELMKQNIPIERQRGGKKRKITKKKKKSKKRKTKRRYKTGKRN